VPLGVADAVNFTGSLRMGALIKGEAAVLVVQVPPARLVVSRRVPALQLTMKLALLPLRLIESVGIVGVIATVVSAPKVEPHPVAPER